MRDLKHTRLVNHNQISKLCLDSYHGPGLRLVETMQIKEHTESRMVLTGIPGHCLWMIVLTGLGLLLTTGICWFVVMVYEEHQGIAWPHLPLALGLLVAQAFLWTGVITLAVGRLMLILDTASGTGEYRVKSPIVDAGRSCVFKLENVQSVTIETTTESRLDRPGHADTVVTVHRARLRLKQPRRTITFDETEHDRLDRLESVAQDVASFLGKTLERID
jgi:hypothetical protein